jgi:hypoxanthine phosphoribosyltransferase
MQILDKRFSIFIKECDIEKRIKELALQISIDYKEKDPIIIVLLNGAFIFASDLIKNIAIPCQVSFIKAASYDGLSSTGEVRQLFGLEEKIDDRHIVILDDIVDTGLTMLKVIESINSQKPASIEVATLLLKTETFNNQFNLKYVGFTIPDNFVVGYGLDYNGYGRNLKDIYHLLPC